MVRTCRLATLALVVAACHVDDRRASPSSPRPFEPLVHDGDAIFFVGNSFFGWRGRRIDEWVAALGATEVPPIHLETAADVEFGHTPLGTFFSREATQAAIASHRYRVFVLQAEEYEPVDHKTEYQAAVREFDRAVRASGGHVVLFLTWDFPWRRFLPELTASVEEIAGELGLPVIPAGLVYDDCRRAPPPNGPEDWLTEGGLHPNEKGAAIDAYAVFAMLTGRNPRGANFQAPGNTNSDAEMSLLSDHVWERVRPLVGGGR